MATEGCQSEVGLSQYAGNIPPAISAPEVEHLPKSAASYINVMFHVETTGFGKLLKLYIYNIILLAENNHRFQNKTYSVRRYDLKLKFIKEF
jgi:hypothetical protein